MDANRVKEISKIILRHFNALQQEESIDFIRDCLPNLVSRVSTDMARNYPDKILFNTEMKNLLINKTFEICKFIDKVRKEDIECLYSVIYPTIISRYINHKIYYETEAGRKSSQKEITLEHIFYSQPDNVIKDFFKTMETAGYGCQGYPKYYYKFGNKLTEVSSILIKHMKATKQKFNYGVKSYPYGHVILHHANCDDIHCQICEGGFSECLVCNNPSHPLTTQCSGKELTGDFINMLNKEENINTEEEYMDYAFKVWYVRKKNPNNTAELNLKTLRNLLNEINQTSYNIQEYYKIENEFKNAHYMFNESESIKTQYEELLKELREQNLIDSLKIPQSEYLFNKKDNYKVKDDLDKYLGIVKEYLDITDTKLTIESAKELINFYTDRYTELKLQIPEEIHSHLKFFFDYVM